MAFVKSLGSITFTARVEYMGEDRSRNSNGKNTVVFKGIKGDNAAFARDHFNAFPEDWADGKFAAFISGDRVGKTYRLTGEVYAYSRKDGSQAVAIRAIKGA